MVLSSVCKSLSLCSPKVEEVPAAGWEEGSVSSTQTVPILSWLPWGHRCRLHRGRGQWQGGCGAGEEAGEQGLHLISAAALYLESVRPSVCPVNSRHEKRG